MAESSDRQILEEIERRGDLTQEEANELERLRSILIPPDSGLDKPIPEQPVPIPPIQKPPLVPPPKPSATYPSTQAGYELAGGMAGGMAGAPLGPPGVAGGAALGVMAGSLTHDAVNRGMQAMGIIDPEVKLRSMPEVLEEAIGEAEIDAAFATGTAGLGILARSSKQVIARWAASNTARQLSQKGASVVRNVLPDAKPLLGVADVTDSNILRSYRRVLGKFPFFAVPFKRAEMHKAATALEVKERLFHKLGPSVGLADLGVDLNKAAKTMWRGVRISSGQRYEKFLRLADERGAIVPTKHIQEWFEEVNEELAKKAVPLKTGTKAVASAKTSHLANFMDKYANIADDVDIHQYRGLMDDWDLAIAQSKDAREDFGVKKLMEFKKQAEVALANISDLKVRQALKDADAYYTRAMKTFEGPMAKRFARTDRRMFKTGFEEAGTLNADELFNALVKSPSPGGFSQLRNLVGQKEYVKALRGYMDNAWTASHSVSPRGDELINIEAFAKQLGLDNPRAVQYSALEDALKSTNLNFKDLKDFVDVARVAFEEGTINVSQFVQRRAVLGGAKSAIRSLSPFAAAGGGAGALFGGAGGAATGTLMPLAGAYMVYRGAKMLARPQELKLLTTALDMAKKTNVRADAMVRLIRLVPAAFEEQEEPKPQATEELDHEGNNERK